MFYFILCLMMILSKCAHNRLKFYVGALTYVSTELLYFFLTLRIWVLSIHYHHGISGISYHQCDPSLNCFWFSDWHLIMPLIYWLRMPCICRWVQNSDGGLSRHFFDAVPEYGGTTGQTSLVQVGYDLRSCESCSDRIWLKVLCVLFRQDMAQVLCDLFR